MSAPIGTLKPKLLFPDVVWQPHPHPHPGGPEEAAVGRGFSQNQLPAEGLQLGPLLRPSFPPRMSWGS